ncbi:MAG: hypothetical protein NC314_00795 [Roseburia sp.]|nr:hypothetical protein [Roseburia sp.]MCM1241351.1 hypothetical protein [Roseburia sp.]
MMKRYKLLLSVLLLAYGICGVSGCGLSKDEEENAGNGVDTGWEPVQESDKSFGDKMLIQDEDGGILEGIIEEQSFEVELDDWGKVMFVSVAPAKTKGAPRFVLAKEGVVVYTFPESETPKTDEFAGVSAVSFTDYNSDGKKDVIVLVQYRNGTEEWSEADVFLQEYSDNMFYMDHPDLKSYRIEAPTENGPAFYKDSLLEEYLLTQRLTDTIASVTGTWAAYMDYVDGLHGYFSTEKQLELLAANRDIWDIPIEYADELCCFTVAGLSYDGCIELIVANYGGTGHYTYSRFYKIDQEGNLQELDTSFREGDSQPDIITEQMTVYSSFGYSEGIRDYYLVYDEIRVSPDEYVYRSSSLCMQDDYILETPLARQTVTYEGEDWSPHTVSEDCNYNVITEEEYESFPYVYYENMGFRKTTAYFRWIDMSELEGKSEAEVVELLRQAYEGFRRE